MGITGGFAAALIALAPAAIAQHLPLWSGGPARPAIVTAEGGPGGIAPCDHDGSLGAGQPNRSPGMSVNDRIPALAAPPPEWREPQRVTAILEGDMTEIAASGAKAWAATPSAVTAKVFRGVVSGRMAIAGHQTFVRPANVLMQPMVKVSQDQPANGFQTWIVPDGDLGPIPHHTGGRREDAHDRASHAGHLDTALRDAPATGGRLIAIARDRSAIFPAR